MNGSYKVRQEMFHKLEQTGDLIENLPHKVVQYKCPDDLIDDIVGYFLEPQDVLKFPAKSYAVAIIYATLLEKYFGVPFDEAISDPHLLFDNDKHFISRNKYTQPIYDQAIFRIKSHGKLKFDDPEAHQLPQVEATINYFKREFYIDPNPYFDNADLS